jgi:hypothetical protein
MLDANLFQLYGEVLQQQFFLPMEDYFQFPPLLCNLLHSLHWFMLITMQTFDGLVLLSIAFGFKGYIHVV